MEQNVKSILLVDDDPLMYEILKAALTGRERYSLTHAQRYSEAVKLIKKQKFDFILLDWNLRRHSGFSLLKEMKSNLKTAWIPIFMLTGRGKMYDVERALSAGANGYFTKPVNLDLMKKRLRRYFNTEHETAA